MTHDIQVLDEKTRSSRKLLSLLTRLSRAFNNL